MNYPTTPQVKRFLPSYRKKTFNVHVYSKHAKLSTSSYFDGGSKNCWTIHNWKTGEVKHPPTGSYPSFRAEYILQENELGIQCGIFMGKPGYASFYIQENEVEEINKNNILGIQIEKE